MEAELGRGSGGRMLRECKEVDYLKKEIRDENAQKQLWSFSEKQIGALEKEGAVKRALAKKEKEVAAEKEKQANGSKTPGSRRSRKAG